MNQTDQIDKTTSPAIESPKSTKPDNKTPPKNKITPEQLLGKINTLLVELQLYSSMFARVKTKNSLQPLCDIFKSLQNLKMRVQDRVSYLERKAQS